jgi:hypothetical protein
MTLVSDIITRGYREGNTKAISFTPSADEQAEGLNHLQSIVDSMFAMVAGIKPQLWFIPTPQKTATRAARYPALLDMNPSSAYDVTLPPPNSRLMMKVTTATTVYFQYEPEDGALMEYVDVGHTATVTLDANGALFSTSGFDGQVVIPAKYPDSRNAPRRWVYRADYGSWVEITALALTDDMPFPTAFDDYWVTSLAIRIAPTFGDDPRAGTVQRHKDMATFLRLQYLQSAPVLVGEIGENSLQSYRSRLDQGDFNDGAPF